MTNLTKTLPTYESACPVCACTDASPCFFRKDLSFQTSDQQYLIARCNACGMGYIRNMPTMDSLDALYPESFYAANSSFHSTSASMENRFSLMQNIHGRLLDIGCAGGEFVQHARQHHFDAVGFDWVQSLEKKEHLYYGGSLAQQFPQDECFDVITMWAVLEHTINLHETMREVQRLLKKNGVFIALVTNFNSLPGRYMQQDDIPRHVNLFTKKSMTSLLHQYTLEPQQWDFSNAIFDGSHRGLLVFLAKQALGERKSDIVAQHRAPGRRDEFCTMLHGKHSTFITSLCALDRWIAPGTDWLAELLHCGFIMTVTAKKVYYG